MTTWIDRQLPPLRLVDLTIPGVLQERTFILDERLRRRTQLLVQVPVVESARHRTSPTH
jgi:hypothetical protein